MQWLKTCMPSHGTRDIAVDHVSYMQGPECTWFEVAVPCSHYTRLAIAAGCIAAVNVALSVAVAMLGGQQMLFSSAGNRCARSQRCNAAILSGTGESVRPVM